MPPTFVHTTTTELSQWENYSGTRSAQNVLACAPKGGDLKVEAASISAVLTHCFANGLPIRAAGTTWSFSSIIQPNKVILDTANLNGRAPIGPNSQSSGYKTTQGAHGFVPVWVQGGLEISQLNGALLKGGQFPNRLCLQTSGAGDGHRMAGCIATGTHGSAIALGALHDTVLAVHLIVAPNKAVLIQSGSAPALEPSFATWLQTQTGVPTTHLADDDLLHAAQVSLGSLGIVYSVVVETVPAYKLLRHTRAINSRDDATLWTAIKTLRSGAYYPGEDDKPWHFEVLFNPYPVAGKPSAHLTVMWKKPAGNAPTATADLVPPAIPSDRMALLGGIAGAVGHALPSVLGRAALGLIINAQIEGLFGANDGTLLFPGQVFGATNLPKGTGASTEIVVDHADTERTVRAMWQVFDEQAALGNYLLGAMALRFVPASKAFLAMNINPMSCYIELPSVRNAGVLAVYEAVWNRLEQLGIPYTCHWGQLGGMNAQRIAKYFKGREAKWKAARARILVDATARKVFAAPLLADVGLE